MEYYGIKKNFQFVSKYIDICKNFYIYTCIYKVSNNRGKNGEKIQRDVRVHFFKDYLFILFRKKVLRNCCDRNRV